MLLLVKGSCRNLLLLPVCGTRCLGPIALACCSCCCLSCGCIKNNKAVSCCWCGWTGPVVQFVFGSVLKKHIDNEDGERWYTIFNYKAPHCYKAILFSNVLQLIGIALMQFWDIFLIEESRICSTDPSLACFPSKPSLDTPHLDCSNTSLWRKTTSLPSAAIGLCSN